MLLARIQRAAKCGDETREEVCDVVRVEHRGGDEVPGVTNATLLGAIRRRWLIVQHPISDVIDEARVGNPVTVYPLCGAPETFRDKKLGNLEIGVRFDVGNED